MSDRQFSLVADSDDAVFKVPIRIRIGNRTATRIVSIPLRDFKPDEITAAVQGEAEPEPNEWRAFDSNSPPVGSQVECGWFLSWEPSASKQTEIIQVTTGGLRPHRIGLGYATHWRKAT